MLLVEVEDRNLGLEDVPPWASAAANLSLASF